MMLVDQVGPGLGQTSNEVTGDKSVGWSVKDAFGVEVGTGGSGFEGGEALSDKRTYDSAEDIA